MIFVTRACALPKPCLSHVINCLSCSTAEEASTPSLDGGLLDLSEATTAAAATPVQPAAAAASSSSRRPFNLPSRLFNRQQQQQQLSEAAALAEQNPTQQDTQAAAAIAESAAAAAGESGSIDQAAAAAAPSALSNLGYVMQLQGNWVAYQLAQMGRVAMAPLTTAKQAVGILAQDKYPCTISSFLAPEEVPLHTQEYPCT